MRIRVRHLFRKPMHNFGSRKNPAAAQWTICMLSRILEFHMRNWLQGLGNASRGNETNSPPADSRAGTSGQSTRHGDLSPRRSPTEAPSAPTMRRGPDIASAYAGQLMAAGPVRNAEDAESRVMKVKNHNHNVNWHDVLEKLTDQTQSGHIDGNSYRLLAEAVNDVGFHLDRTSSRPATVADYQAYRNF